ncbi:MAG: putative DNA-binding protein [Actinomycetia bacterium]|nr:putative DNA-binding protein [Actinomycetes bacterium]
MKVIPFSDQAAGGIQGVRGSVHTAERYAETGWFRVYEPSVIPGPLQSPSYTAALQDFWAGHLCPGMDEDERATSVLEAVKGQQDRARIALNRAFHVLIEESALYYAISGPDVLAGALRHLLVETDSRFLPQLSVIPRDQGRDVPPQAPFWLLDHDLACGETSSFSWTEEDPAAVRVHEDLFRCLRLQAVHGQAARELVTEAYAIAQERAGLPVKFEA